MYYREIAGVKVSALGMGNMRLPTVDGQEARIAKAQAQEIIDYAMSHGINYYDTAYRYHGGESERFIGEALEKYPRDSFLLASKFPGHMMVKKGGRRRGLHRRPCRVAGQHGARRLCRADGKMPGGIL